MQLCNKSCPTEGEEFVSRLLERCSLNVVVILQDVAPGAVVLHHIPLRGVIKALDYLKKTERN